MSSPPRQKVFVGVHRKNGVAEIVPIDFPIDMGDHGRVCILKTIKYFSLNSRSYVDATFSYCNTKTSNCIYREI